MRLVDAVRVDDAGENPREVWIEDGPLPRIGSEFEVEGVRYRRLPNGSTPTFGRELKFDKPVVMWSEPLRGRGAIPAPHYTHDGYAVFTTNREVREYEARSRDSGRPVTWTK